MNRRGISVLVIVCTLAFAVGAVALAMHQLWRGSSRGLFGVQQQRELVNLGHSAIAEAIWSIETKLEQGSSEWVDWVASPRPASPREEAVPVTDGYVNGLTGDNANLIYHVSKVEIVRVQGAPLAAGMSGRLGVLDFNVTVEAVRATPAYRAAMKMTRRHACWFSDGISPFTNGGRHIEILPTPVATFLEYQ